MSNHYPTFESLKRRVEELETALTAKGTKILKKMILPQPTKTFHSNDALNLLFRQLLKIHDADEEIKANFDYVRAFGTHNKPDNTPLYEPIGQMIILLVTYLDKKGCNVEQRQLLFDKLNKQNNDENS